MKLKIVLIGILLGSVSAFVAPNSMDMSSVSSASPENWPTESSSQVRRQGTALVELPIGGGSMRLMYQPIDLR